MRSLRRWFPGVRTRTATNDLHPLEVYPREYGVVPDPELPGDGVWRLPVHWFDRDGPRRSEVLTGERSYIVVEPTGSQPWIGAFAGGYVVSAWATPSPRRLVVIAGRVAHYIDVDDPMGAELAHEDVSDVMASHPDLLLLVSEVDIVAIDPNGIRWMSSRLATSHLRINMASDEMLVCSGELSRDDLEEIRVDRRTGEAAGDQTAWTREAQLDTQRLRASERRNAGSHGGDHQT